MGEIQVLTKEQKIILDEISQSEYLRSHFYFTRGTALSAYYLHHRDSDDIDIFSQEKIDNEVILGLMQNWSTKNHFTFTSNFVEVVYRFNLTFSDTTSLKVDFACYPYKQIEKPTLINNFPTDSLVDIAVNKLFTISQRDDIKDFVDLYFLLQKFSFWDLREGVRMKFRRDIEPLLLATDFLKAEDFDYLPRMIVPLSLDNLKVFFREEAKKLGKTAVR